MGFGEKLVSLLSSKPVFRLRLQAEAWGTPFLPCLWAPRIAPTAAKPPHLLPQVILQEGHTEASTRSPHGLR